LFPSVGIVFPFNDARLRLLECCDDADALLDVDLDVLGGDPLVLVLQELERHLGVGAGALEQRVGRDHLPVGAPLFLSLARERVQFLQPAQLGRRHVGGVGQVVVAQAQARGLVDALEALLGRVQGALAEGQGEEHAREPSTV